MLRMYFLLALALGVASALAEPVTLSRVRELPAVNQAVWQAYWERSQAHARADQTALEAEVRANNLTSALRAPSGGDFKLPTKTGNAWYGGEEARQLADTILSYQTPGGGWSKHTGYSKRPRQPGMQWTSQNAPGQKPHYVATFDNRATTEEMYFLAAVWHATQRDDCKAGFSKD